MSFGREILPLLDAFIMSCFMSSVIQPVSTGPGSSEFMRMFSLLSSGASCSANMSTAALVVV